MTVVRRRHVNDNGTKRFPVALATPAVRQRPTVVAISLDPGREANAFSCETSAPADGRPAHGASKHPRREAGGSSGLEVSRSGAAR